MMLIAAAAPAASTNRACPSQMYQRAEFTLAHAKIGWPELLKHWTAFRACDDGALGENYSDIVVKNLAHRWTEITVLSALSKRQPEFRQWAVAHIDATASDDDLNQILRNTAGCSREKDRRLCLSIKHAAVNALREQKQLLLN